MKHGRLDRYGDVDACKPNALCWRAEELIAEVFGVEEGALHGKTTADAYVEIRRLRRLRGAERRTSEASTECGVMFWESSWPTTEHRACRMPKGHHRHFADPPANEALPAFGHCEDCGDLRWCCKASKERAERARTETTLADKASYAKGWNEAVDQCLVIVAREMSYWKSRQAEGTFACENIEYGVRKLATPTGSDPK